MASETQPQEDLPLFPLPEVVLFPGCLLPLHIFEPRYREMINECLDNETAFGILNVDPGSKQPAQIGCSAHILEAQKLPDGRMNILTIGRSRFRVNDYKYDRAFLVGTVEWIEDQEQPGEELDDLALKMKSLLKDVVRLSAKLADKNVEFPEDLPSQPQELSFWVAGSFPGLPDEQQSLLEMMDTSARLKRETEILSSACKQLAARTAIKDAMGGGDSDR
jgi:ATP-dependent Lon protease